MVALLIRERPIRFAGMKLTLIGWFKGLRIEVNGLPLLLPYSGNGVNIFEQKHKLRLTTRVGNYAHRINKPPSTLFLGISILWDGRSMLEITAKPELKNSLFGLCGNFDGDARNDFNSSTGNVMLDSNEFAQSWKIPGEGFCSIQSPSVRNWTIPTNFLHNSSGDQ